MDFEQYTPGDGQTTQREAAPIDQERYAAHQYIERLKREKEEAEEELKYYKSQGKLRAALAAFFMIIMLLTGLIIGRLVSVRTDMGFLSKSGTEKLRFIKDTLDQNFLFDMDQADFESGIMKGYMNALGDPYSVYYTKEEYDSLMESTLGFFSGIGVVVTQSESGIITVVKPYKTGPGARAGILPDDILFKVEGEEVTGQDLSLVVSKIKGPEGTNVQLTVFRPSSGEYIDMDITREKIEIETVTYEMLEDRIGLIAMDSFDDVTYGQFMSAFEDLKSQGMKALIVDIRNNGGGLLNSVVDILSELLPPGIITYTEDKNGKQKQYRSETESQLDIPAAVLVNGNSASASEIFTGALKDYGKATIIGTKTFGKGIVQTIMSMNDGSAIKYTTSRYFTPKGVCIHGVGIEPDIVVEPDFGDGDAQLKRALEEMKAQMK